MNFGWTLLGALIVMVGLANEMYWFGGLFALGMAICEMLLSRSRDMVRFFGLVAIGSLAIATDHVYFALVVGFAWMLGEGLHAAVRARAFGDVK